MEFEISAEPSDPTPGMVNGDQATETGAQKMAREDKHGFVLSGVSVLVVFCALLILWWLFSLLGKVSGGTTAKPAETRKRKRSMLQRTEKLLRKSQRQSQWPSTRK